MSSALVGLPDAKATDHNRNPSSHKKKEPCCVLFHTLPLSSNKCTSTFYGTKSLINFDQLYREKYPIYDIKLVSLDSS